MFNAGLQRGEEGGEGGRTGEVGGRKWKDGR